MTYGGNSFNDFPELVPTREIKINIEKTFSRPWPCVYFLNGPNAARSIAPTLIALSFSQSILCRRAVQKLELSSDVNMFIKYVTEKTFNISKIAQL